jgi:hypothetical protein
VIFSNPALQGYVDGPRLAAAGGIRALRASSLEERIRVGLPQPTRVLSRR